MCQWAHNICSQVSSCVDVSTLHTMFLQVWMEELWLEMSVENYHVIVLIALEQPALHFL